MTRSAVDVRSVVVAAIITVACYHIVVVKRCGCRTVIECVVCVLCVVCVCVWRVVYVYCTVCFLRAVLFYGVCVNILYCMCCMCCTVVHCGGALCVLCVVWVV